MTAAAGTSRVSVVITTIGRPELAAVLAAVDTQTMPALEIIVVDDRPLDRPAELDLPPGRNGPPVRLLRSGGRGGNAARNTGIRAAAGDLVALLDDDDYWEPDKLERQVAELDRAAATGNGLDMVFCQFVNETTGTVLPAYPLDDSIPLEQWLFCPPAVLTPRLAAVQTSGIVFRVGVRDHLEFDEELAAHQDWDWVIRFARLPGARVLLVQKPLYVLSGFASNKTSMVRRLEHQLDWALDRLAVSPRALFGYLWMWTVPQAVASRSWRVLARALRLSVTRAHFDAASFVQGSKIVASSVGGGRRASGRNS